MNNDTGINVVSSLFGFFSGRFSNLPVAEDLRNFLQNEGPLKGLVIDIHVKRDMTVIGFTNHSFHGPMFLQRYPIEFAAGVNTDLYFKALRGTISAAVLTVKALPNAMLCRTLSANGAESDWESVERDDLGNVISKGLLAKQCTLCFGAGEFSVFYASGDVRGYNFKAPTYINNIFWLPTRGNPLK